MRLVTLIENTTSREDLAFEHGLSLYVETGEHRILFDMGASDAFAANAQKLGVDLNAVDVAVLSHGHNDHGGGLETFLACNDRAPVYLHRDAFEPHFNATEKEIGLNPALQGSNRLRYVEDRQEIGPGLTLLSCNGCQRPYPFGNFGLTVRRQEGLRPDDFRHELYLLIEEKGRRVCISGCSHKGILNIMHWLRPDVLVGGFHFMKLDPEADREELERAAAGLQRYPAQYYTGHCTGAGPYGFLKARMGSCLEAVSSGAILEL